MPKVTQYELLLPLSSKFHSILLCCLPFRAPKHLETCALNDLQMTLIRQRYPMYSLRMLQTFTLC